MAGAVTRDRHDFPALTAPWSRPAASAPTQLTNLGSGVTRYALLSRSSSSCAARERAFDAEMRQPAR